MEIAENESLNRRIAELERELAETRQRAEVLEREKSRLEDFLELMPQPVFEVDTEGRILYANEMAVTLFGYARDEGKAELNILQMIAPETREFAWNAFSRALREGQPKEEEFTALRKDRSTFPVNIYSVPFSQGGELRGLRGFMVDISARKLMEEALRESESKYRKLLDMLPYAMYELRLFRADVTPEERERILSLVGEIRDASSDEVEAVIRRVGGELMPYADGEILFLNQTAERILGYPASRMEKLTIPDLIPPEFLGKSFLDILTIFTRKVHVDLEYPVISAGGARQQVSVNVCLVNDEYPFIIEGVARDITRQREMEAALRESERRYRLIFNTVPVSIWEYDFNGLMPTVEKLRALKLADYRRYLMERPEIMGEIFSNLRLMDVNPETLRLYGAASMEEIDGPYRARHTPEAVEVHRDAFAAFLEGKSYFTGEAVNETLDGRHIDVLIQMNFPAEAELKGRVLVAAIDITARKQLEEERLKADKLESIGLLAGGIAHDFNNILVSILGNISLARTCQTVKEIRDILSNAETAALRARDLTNQLLTFSKGGAPTKEAASITEIIRDSSGFCLRGSNVRCECTLPDDLWPVEADRGQMSQVVNNLILNARYAMPGGGTIMVGGGNMEAGPGDGLPLTPGRYVKVVVGDQGIGIPPENLSRIFDPYFTTKENGTGLGLATTWSIIRNHGGHIQVDSSERLGSVFTLYLPAAGTNPEMKGIERSSGADFTWRILVMDDEPTVREVLAQMLIYLGHDAETCREGNEALLRYRESREAGHPFDAVIMDLTIPGGMGGKEAARELLAYDPDGRVIVSSGYSAESISSDYKEHGFRAILAKPYQLEDLREVLARVLN